MLEFSNLIVSSPLHPSNIDEVSEIRDVSTFFILISLIFLHPLNISLKDFNLLTNLISTLTGVFGLIVIFLLKVEFLISIKIFAFETTNSL